MKIYGSGLDGYENTALVDSNGRLLVNASISGNIIIGSVTANVDSIYVQSGLITLQEVTPIDNSQNNPLYKFEYITSGTSNEITGSRIGKIIEFIGVGSYVNDISYLDNRISKIGSSA